MCLQWLSWLRYHNESDFICYFERFCMFSKGVSWGWNLDFRGFGGDRTKKIFQARYRSPWPPCNTRLIFTLSTIPRAQSFIIGVKVRTTVIYHRDRTSPLLEVTKCGVTKGARVDHFWPPRHRFLPFDREYLENGKLQRYMSIRA